MSESLPRVVLLGASNARRGLSSFVNTARALSGGPIELLAAIGHGRSYGNWSSIPGRALPGIVECGLWGVLSHTNTPTTALITDIGNDLLYNVEPPWLVGWVEECVEQLNDAGAEVVVTELPLGNLNRLGPARYRFFRTLFFPGCPFSLAELSDRAFAVNDGLRRVAERLGARLEPPRSEWYGLDPIHLKRSAYRAAWRELFSPVFPEWASRETRNLRLPSRVALSLAAPEERRLFGIDRRRPQPCCRLPDGSRVSLY